MTSGALPAVLADRIRERIVASPLGRLLALEVVALGAERVQLAMPYREAITTIGDLVHGGAISALIDTAATAVAWSGVAPASPPSRGTTVSLVVSFLAGARGQRLVATAIVARRGRSICFCDVDVHDADGQLVAQGRAVYKLG